MAYYRNNILFIKSSRVLHPTDLWRVVSSNYNILSIVMFCFIINAQSHELTMSISAGRTTGFRKLVRYSQNRGTVWLEVVWEMICSPCLLKLSEHFHWDSDPSIWVRNGGGGKSWMTFLLFDQLWLMAKCFYFPLPWLNTCNNFKAIRKWRQVYKKHKLQNQQVVTLVINHVQGRMSYQLS